MLPAIIDLVFCLPSLSQATLPACLTLSCELCTAPHPATACPRGSQDNPSPKHGNQSPPEWPGDQAHAGDLDPLDSLPVKSDQVLCTFLLRKEKLNAAPVFSWRHPVPVFLHPAPACQGDTLTEEQENDGTQDSGNTQSSPEPGDWAPREGLGSIHQNCLGERRPKGVQGAEGRGVGWPPKPSTQPSP